MQPFNPPPKPNYAAPLVGLAKPVDPNAKLIPRLAGGQIDYAALAKIADPKLQPKPVFTMGGK
jgi:hypothetical protein